MPPPKTIAIAVCAALVGGLLVVGWNNIGGSYSECLVSEMRGMPTVSGIQTIIRRVCRERYPK